MLPEASSTVNVIVVTAPETVVPAAGLCVIVAPLQLSSKTAKLVKSGTIELQFASVVNDCSPGHSIVGFSLSITVITCVH